MLEFKNSPFCNALPSRQNAVDLFGDWASCFPNTTPLQTQGKAGLFNDPRVAWFDQQLKALNSTGVSGCSVIEFGPLEAGHTYMLSQLGASSITAIEANGVSFLKCILVKDLMKLNRADFLLGDAVKHLEHSTACYDVGFCCGFLYHLTEPVSFIRLLSEHCQYVYVWTITYDESLFQKQPEMKPLFGEPLLVEEAGASFTVYPHYYGNIQDYKGFRGGCKPSSCWMRKAEILRAFEHHGFVIEQSQEEANPFGLAISLLARNTRQLPAREQAAR